MAASSPAANSFSAAARIYYRAKPDLLELGCEEGVQFEFEGFQATICSDRGNLAFSHTEAISDILISKKSWAVGRVEWSLNVQTVQPHHGL